MSAEDPLHWPLVVSYLDAAADDRLTVPECAKCGETFFPLRTVCPYCLSSEVDLRESSGEGVVYSFSVVHLEYHPIWGEEAPYVNALIDLDDGPVVFANLVDCDPDDVEVGLPVEVRFESVDGQPLPVFVTR